MSLYPQPLLDIHEKLIVDLFAGGGGASSGIEQATGRMVDIAINHDATAVALHEANHPQTRHYVSDVFEVDPRVATGGRPVGLLWASPDCTYHSKARGAKPIRSANKKRRALAWVVTRWAGTVKPDVIILENVEEFADWGPLVGPKDELRPCPKRRGKTFRAWVRSLQQQGYAVEWRELKACDFGSPTIRKRLFLIARRDGQPIVWPEPTHGPGRAKPYRTVAECIDWSIPMCSIFATADEAKEWARDHGIKNSPIRPLADNTMARIARGVKKFVLDAAKPFLVTVNHGEGDDRRVHSTENPLQTITAKNSHAIAAPFITTYYGDRPGSNVRGQSADQPVATQTTENRHAIIAPYLVPRYGERPGQKPRSRGVDSPGPVIVPGANGGSLAAVFLGQANYDETGRPADAPISTILANSRGHQPIIAAHIKRDFGTSTGHAMDRPIGTLTTEGSGKAALVYSFMSQYNGTSIGQPAFDPLNTIPTHDRFGVVTVMINGEPYAIQDIGMRMLTPRELFRCQGFRASYVIDRTINGTPISKTDQVRLCGNSVCPDVAEALVAANCAELIARKRESA